MTILAFFSVAIAFAFAIVSTCLFFGGLEIHDNTSSNVPSNTVKTVPIVFEESTPIYQTPNSVKTQRIDFGAYRAHRLHNARINALAIIADAADAADCIKWATARDGVSGKYSFNPLAMSDQARFGYDKVFSGEDALMRIQDILSDMDVTALANW